MSSAPKRLRQTAPSLPKAWQAAGRYAAAWLLCLGPWLGPALGGGSGLNVTVVVNQRSPASLALGNDYLEKRRVPSQNLVRIDWPGDRINWTRAECQTVLVEPLTDALSQRGLANQIDVVLLSMDIPYRVYEGPDVNSTTSMLFYGFKTNDWTNPVGCRLSPESEHDYFASELPFRPRPGGTNGPRFLVTMLTADTLAEAQQTIDRGVASDGLFPNQAAVLQKTSDVARNVRYQEFDRAVFESRVAGQFPLTVVRSDQTLGLTGLQGLQTGLAAFELSSDTFLPGAMADSLTSLGGYLFEPSGQTSLLVFLRAGATASYGTVVEPCNYTEKFPAAMAYFYQARGFALAESYYQSLECPYQGLVVGEPLAAPCARPGQAAWTTGGGPDQPPPSSGPPTGPPLRSPPPEPLLLAGVTNLSLQCLAADAARPLQQVDLFVDGTLASTLTNLSPAAGNVLSVKIDRLTLQSAVPPAATLSSVVSLLTDTLNAKSDITSVYARSVGDRLELTLMDASRSGPDVSLATSQAAGTASALTTFIRAAQPRFLDSPAHGRRTCDLAGVATAADFLQCTFTKTTGERVTVAVTNQDPPASTALLAGRLIDQLHASPALQGPDGVSAEDIVAPTPDRIQFHLVARSPGLAAAQLRCQWTVSPNLNVSPRTVELLNENLADLRPRNHLHIAAGSPSLALTIPWDTTAWPDGFHELTAVAYEGTSIRTQTRAPLTVRIRNTPLEATLHSRLAADSVAVEALLPFDVAANRSEIMQIELCGTGGLLATASHQPAASFTLEGSQLGAGRHRFFARVTAADGSRFQTAPVTLFLVARDVPFRVTIREQPPELSWPAVPGRAYDVLGGPSIQDLTTWEARVASAEGGTLTWSLPHPPSTPRFYRIQVPTSP